MSTDKTNQAIDRSIDSTATSSTSDAVNAPNPNWSRRTFLKAAALGAATAAVLGKGSTSVLAHDDTKSACTANDIEVFGGRIINEPCDENTPFRAVAQFTVRNQNNATRKCITLHLSGGGIGGQSDFLLVNDPSGDPATGISFVSSSGTEQIMYAALGTLPANTGVLCFNNSTVAFQTAQNQSTTACSGPLTKYPGGQCRRQDICFVGFSATLSCVDNCTDQNPSNCSVSCGGTLSLLATATGASEGATAGTYTFTLLHPDGTTAETRSNVSSPQCFTVSSADVQPGKYKIVCTDSEGCSRSAESGSVTTSSITAHIAVSGNSACNSGVLTFTGSADGCSGTPTFRFRVDSGSWVNGSGTNNAQFTYSPPTVTGGGLDTACHTVTVEASCSGCTDTTSCSVSQCVTSTVGAEDTAC